MTVLFLGLEYLWIDALMAGVICLLPGLEKRMSDELEQKIKDLERHCLIGNRIIHNLVVANQAAWIEWQRGEGAEAAMRWVHNGLVGPGHIPADHEPPGDDPQSFYDANIVDVTDETTH